MSGEVVSVGAAVISTVIAAAAVVVAQLARRDAKQAHQLAEAANQLSSKANVIAGEANRIAVGANELSEEANAISRAQVELVNEVHDVQWEGRWVGPGCYVLVNMGQDEARDVRATLRVDEEEARATAERVPAGEHVVFDLPEARDHLVRERADRARRANQVASGGGVYVDDWELPATHRVAFRVDWRTPLGAAKRDEGEHDTCRLE